MLDGKLFFFTESEKGTNNLWLNNKFEITLNYGIFLSLFFCLVDGGSRKSKKSFLFVKCFFFRFFFWLGLSKALIINWWQGWSMG